MKKLHLFHVSLLIIAGILAFCLTSCIKDDPDLPELITLAVTDVSPYAARSGGDIRSDGGGGISVRGLIWKAAAGVSIDDFEGMAVAGVGTGVYYADISGLTPGTTYFVRAYATNAAGTAYGEEASFTTEATTANVLTVEVTEITSVSAITGGEVTNDGGAEITARGVVWHTTENPSLSTEGAAFTEDGTGMGSFTSQLSELIPGATYFVRAYVTNIAGTVYGEQKQFTTDPSVPVVETLSASNITHAAATLNGHIVFDGGTVTMEKGFYYSASPDPGAGDSMIIATGDDNPFSATISGLEPTTIYYVRAYATNEVGTTLAEVIMFETQADPVNDGDPCPGIPTVTDTRDGNVYNTVYIGGQCWLREPMRWLPEVYPPENSSNTEKRYYVYGYFGSDLAEAKAMESYQHYGTLYSWHAAMEACPPGWHLSTDSEWTALINHMVDNYEEVQLSNVGNALKSRRQVNSPLGSPWATEEHPRFDEHGVHHGLDLAGFGAIPAGMRAIPPPGIQGYYFSYGREARYWTSTQSGDFSWTRSLAVSSGAVGRWDLFREYGFAVRCVRSAQ